MFANAKWCLTFEVGGIHLRKDKILLVSNNNYICTHTHTYIYIYILSTKYNNYYMTELITQSKQVNKYNSGNFVY